MQALFAVVNLIVNVFDLLLCEACARKTVPGLASFTRNKLAVVALLAFAALVSLLGIGDGTLFAEPLALSKPVTIRHLRHDWELFLAEITFDAFFASKLS